MPIKIFVDSGAPSLYNQLVRKDKNAGHMGAFFGDRRHDDFSFVETDEYREYLEGYIAFIKEHIDIIDVYANLDVVNNAAETLKNQRHMEAEGLKPIPVWHLGTPIRYLVRYLSEGYPYIALGGMIPNPPSVLLPMLDGLWDEHLTHDDGMPKVKVHGFAVTSPLLVARYPWYSVDSTSWVKYGKYGIVCVPRFKQNRLRFEESPWTVCVSTRSPMQQDEGRHITTLSPAERAYALRYFEEKGYVLGRSTFKTIEGDYELQENESFATGHKGDPVREVEVIHERGLCNDYRFRDELNILYYLDLESSVPEWPWAFKHKEKMKGHGLWG